MKTEEFSIAEKIPHHINVMKQEMMAALLLRDLKSHEDYLPEAQKEHPDYDESSAGAVASDLRDDAARRWYTLNIDKLEAAIISLMVDQPDLYERWEGDEAGAREEIIASVTQKMNTPVAEVEEAYAEAA